MFASLPDIESQIDQHIEASQFDEALANIMVGVHNHYQLPDVENHLLYYPRFDQQIQQLADALAENTAPFAIRPLTDNTLIVASMMHQVGGHSHVIADVVREVSRPTVVLTDMLRFYENAPEQNYWLHEAFAHATVISLTQLSLWAKSRALYLLTQRLQPNNILYFNHHQDPIPFVGTLGHRGSRKTLLHHCDHHPSLGNTLAGIRHVDFVEEMAMVCAKQLDRSTLVLPLYVADRGVKNFTPIRNGVFSAVTSGAYVKYARDGEMSLQNIVRTVLSSLSGEFFHIGAIDPTWISDIKAHLASVGIAPQRFVALGQVRSVWDTLASLDAHVYIGSAPTGGGRAATEAQGCGYPLLFFRVTNLGPALGSDSVYADKRLGWSTLAELSELLAHIGPRQRALSETARTFYEQHFSRDRFVQILGEICGSQTTSSANDVSKISVFIPVFNGEKYLAETLDSVLNQTLSDFELICIDDGSSDSSLSLLRLYASKDPRVRVLQTPENLGLVSKVLNFSLPFMQGGYFVYSSQDDLHSKDWLEKMRARAIETGADAVIPDLVFYHANDNSRSRMLRGLHGDRSVVLSSRDAVLLSLDWEIPGNALWRAELIKKYGFEEFGLNSDEYSTRVFFLNCNKVAFSEGTFYYRQDNDQAVTKKVSFKTFDYPYTQFRLYQLLKESNFPASTIQGEAIKVIKLMATLRQWLTMHHMELSPDDLKKAESRMEKCMEHLKSDAMFSQVI